MQLVNFLIPGMHGAFYGRHSTDKQEMLMQQNSVQEWIRKYDCTIVKEYLDPNVSATKRKVADRKALMQLLEDCEKGNYDFVAVYNNDRLARNPLEHEYIRATMRILGIPIVISSSDSLYDSQHDLISQLLKDGISKFEVDNIRARTRDGLQTRAQGGLWTGGVAPFAYRYQKGKGEFILLQEEASIVREIFTLYRKGEGFRAIAEELASQPQFPNFNWSKDKVKSIVTNPFYAGFLGWGKRSNTAKSSINSRDDWIIVRSPLIEPIITMEEWETCWKLYQDRKENIIPPKHFKTSFIFRGIASCGECKVPLRCKDQTTTSSAGKNYGRKVYLCPECELRLDACTFHQFVLDHVLNEVRIIGSRSITKSLSERFEHDILALQKECDSLQVSIDEYQKQLVQTNEQIRNAMCKSDADMLVSVLTRYRGDLQERITLASQQIKAKQTEIACHRTVDRSESKWQPTLDAVMSDRNQISQMDARRMLIHLIDRITVDRNNKIEYRVRFDMDKRSVNALQPEFLF